MITDCVFQPTPDGAAHYCPKCDPAALRRVPFPAIRRNCKAPAPDHYTPPPYVQPPWPGTELKKLLRKFGIVASSNCKCNARAIEMDNRGPDWCEKNIELIVDWLQEEAEKRRLPFLRSLGKLLVKRAIRNARKKEPANEPH